MHSGKPDDIDLKIMRYLQENARMNLGKLGSLVGLTIGPLTTRIEKLENAGVIRKYMAILDREKISFPVLVLLMVKLKQQNTQLLDEFEALACAMPEVLSCHNMSGSWNFILQVAASTPQAYAVWLLEKVNMHPNVGNVESLFLMKECKSYGSFVFQPNI
jgi:Lrp/AsnC family leucine-responsive transcriptional regulator